MSVLRRRVRGIVGNTVVWGVGWAVLGFAAHLVLRQTGVIAGPVAMYDAALVGLKVGVGGGIAGAAFAAVIALVYRHRRLQDIQGWKFGGGGAVVTAVSITGFVQGASVLGGGSLVEWEYMQPTLTLFTVFGFTVAALSLKVAQWAAVRDADRVEAAR